MENNHETVNPLNEILKISDSEYNGELYKSFDLNGKYYSVKVSSFKRKFDCFQRKIQNINQKYPDFWFYFQESLNGSYSYFNCRLKNKWRNEQIKILIARIDELYSILRVNYKELKINENDFSDNIKLYNALSHKDIRNEKEYEEALQPFYDTNGRDIDSLKNGDDLFYFTLFTFIVRQKNADINAEITMAKNVICKIQGLIAKSSREAEQIYSALADRINALGRTTTQLFYNFLFFNDNAFEKMIFCEIGGGDEREFTLFEEKNVEERMQACRQIVFDVATLKGLKEELRKQY
jgi:hypothetical protein